MLLSLDNVFGLPAPWDDAIRAPTVKRLSLRGGRVLRSRRGRNDKLLICCVTCDELLRGPLRNRMASCQLRAIFRKFNELIWLGRNSWPRSLRLRWRASCLIRSTVIRGGGVSNVLMQMAALGTSRFCAVGKLSAVGRIELEITGTIWSSWYETRYYIKAILKLVSFGNYKRVLVEIITLTVARTFDDLRICTAVLGV